MSKPSSYVDWDTGNVHTIPVTAGHAASGVAANEVPNSGEFNSWMMFVGLWIRYFSLILNAGTWQNYRLDLFDLGVNYTPEFMGGMRSTSTSGSLGPAVVSLPDGLTVTDIRCRLKGAGIGGNTITVTFFRCDDTSGISTTVLATLTITDPPASWADYTVALGTPEVVSADGVYGFGVDFVGTNNAHHIQSIGAKSNWS